MARACEGHASMICELVTLGFEPGAVAKWEASFAEALSIRARHSELGGSWHTDIGALNEVVQIWPYDSFEHRADVHAKVSRVSGWPPKGSDAILRQERQILIPVPFCPEIGGGQKLGSIYEMRFYHFRPGSMPTVIDLFETAVQGGRLELSPLAGMFHGDTGNLDVLMHLWPYQSFAERSRVRSETRKLDSWPPPIGEFLVAQENKILIPATFSPMA